MKTTPEVKVKAMESINVAMERVKPGEKTNAGGFQQYWSQFQSRPEF